MPMLLEAEHVRKTYRLGRHDVPVLKGASMAVAENLPVQQVPYAAMKEKLVALKQKLERPV